VSLEDYLGPMDDIADIDGFDPYKVD